VLYLGPENIFKHCWRLIALLRKGTSAVPLSQGLSTQIIKIRTVLFRGMFTVRKRNVTLACETWSGVYVARPFNT
jgi:hypothetical protein